MPAEDALAALEARAETLGKDAPHGPTTSRSRERL
jgi:hypothetical protein